MATTQKKFQPFDIFRHAESFFSAIDYLNTAPPLRISPMVAPMLVFAAFASELYLKTLLALEGSKIPRSHLLHDLFSSLDQRDRLLVEGHWEPIQRDRGEFNKDIEIQGGEVLPSALDDALIEGNNCFDQIR